MTLPAVLPTLTTLDLTGVRNNDNVYDLTVTNAAYTNVPLDITGWTFVFTVKRWVSDPDPLAVFQTRTGDSSGCVAILDAPSGQVQFKLPAIKTRGEADTPFTLVYDVEAILPSGLVRTIQQGKLAVSMSVTQAIA